MFGHVSGRLWAPFVVRERWAHLAKKLNTQQKGNRLTTSSAGGARAASKDAKANDEMHVVNVFVKNAFEEVRAYLQPYKGGPLAHIRVFTPDKNDVDRPTKKGIALNIRDLPKLAQAVDALRAATEASRT
jgi:Transcriptional Coactivator p15 (PC4)